MLRGFSIDDEPDPSCDVKSSSGYRMTLWNKTSVILLYTLAATGKAVLNYGATGCVTESPISLPQDELVFHNILSISATNALVATADAKVARGLKIDILKKYFIIVHLS